MSKKNLNIEIIGFKDIEMPVPFFYAATLEYKCNGKKMSMRFYSGSKHPNDYKKEYLIKSIRKMLENPDQDIYITSRDE